MMSIQTKCHKTADFLNYLKKESKVFDFGVVILGLLGRFSGGADTKCSQEKHLLVDFDYFFSNLGPLYICFIY